MILNSRLFTHMFNCFYIGLEEGFFLSLIKNRLALLYLISKLQKWNKITGSGQGVTGGGRGGGGGGGCPPDGNFFRSTHFFPVKDILEIKEGGRHFPFYIGLEEGFFSLID